MDPDLSKRRGHRIRSHCVLTRPGYPRRMSDDWKPRLKWRRTNLQSCAGGMVENDFTANPPDRKGQCRILPGLHPHHGLWAWSASTWMHAGSGYEATARDAARAAEDAYFRQAAKDDAAGLFHLRRLTAPQNP